MALSAKKAASNKKWDAANLDRISIALPKGQRDTIKAAAAAAGKSVNAYIIDAINARMSGAPAPVPAAEQPRKSPAPEQPAQKSPEQPKHEQRKPEPIRRLSMEELMALREQKLAAQNKEEQFGAQEAAEQPKKPNPETLPPMRTIDYSPDAIPPELLEKIERVRAAQNKAITRENESANSTEKNPPASGTNAEQR